jgi:hypothetical protein
MELKAITDYFANDFSLVEGENTKGLELSEERKAELLASWPERFEEYVEDLIDKVAEVVGDAVNEVMDELAGVTPEDALAIETPEDKLPKSRKK